MPKQINYTLNENELKQIEKAWPLDPKCSAFHHGSQFIWSQCPSFCCSKLLGLYISTLNSALFTPKPFPNHLPPILTIASRKKVGELVPKKRPNVPPKPLDLCYAVSTCLSVVDWRLSVESLSVSLFLLGALGDSFLQFGGIFPCIRCGGTQMTRRRIALVIPLHWCHFSAALPCIRRHKMTSQRH